VNDPKAGGDLTRATLAEVGPRLRAARQRRSMTLGALAAATGISASTLSRLESGKRAPKLELLIPVTRELRIGLDDLMMWHAVPPRPAPRLPAARGMTVEYLSPAGSAVQVLKMVLSPTATPSPARSHGGFQTVYVLRGKAKIKIGDDAHTVNAGQAFEFDTRIAHSVIAIGRGPVEVLTVFSRQGEPIRPVDLTAVDGS